MRDSRVDNAKGILIFLVVLGHFVEAVKGWEETGLRGLWTAIYLFHMPTFIFLAGMTAKTDNMLRRVLNLAVLLVFFHCAYVAPLTIVDGGKYPTGILQPYWAMWFLMSMIWWLLLLPVINRLPYPFVMSMMMALAAGLVPVVDYAFSFSRTLVFLPFFVAGHLYGWRLLARLKQPPTLFLRLGGIVLLSCIVAVLLPYDLAGNWFRGSQGYGVLGVGSMEGVLIRGGLLLVAALALVFFMAALPASNNWLTRLGAASMAVFLLHGFVVKPLGKLAGEMAAQLPMEYLLLLLMVLSALTTVILGSPALDRVIRQQAGRMVDRVLAVVAKAK